MSHSTLKSIKMKALITFLFFIFFNAFCGQTQTTSPTTGPQDGQQHNRRAQRSERTSGSRAIEPVSTEQCISNGCPCCVFLSRRAGTVCKDDHFGMENEEELWGSYYQIERNGYLFLVFNANPAQIAKIQEIIDVLPTGYLTAIPKNFRIGNPRNGRKNVSASGTVGGGSRRCAVKNADYEYIIIHPDVFTLRSENPYLTILHEMGHFIDREFALSQSLLSEHSDHFREYLASYRGDSRGNDEVISQGIMYYFYRKHFDRRRLGRTIIPWSDRSRFPEWLKNIIEQDVQNR